MSLDVLLEAADVLEKQKVASILTSMHEYDKNFTSNNADNMYPKQQLENKPYHSPQHEMMKAASKPTNLLISEETEHMPLSPSNKRMQHGTSRRRFTATKMATNYTVVTNTSPSPNIPASVPEPDAKVPAKELYTFKVENDSSRSRSSGGGGGETWHTRSIHNQMEKNRRAQLRVYMNNLRDVIPSGPNRRKLTTLTLLQNARAYIESLKEHEEEYEHDKQKLWRRHLQLREFLCQLSGNQVLTLPGIPITPGIRKFSVSQEQTTEQEAMCPTCEDPSENTSVLSDGTESIGTFSNSDGGDTTVSPDKEL